MISLTREITSQESAELALGVQLRKSVTVPRFKVGVTYWRSSPHRQLQIGTSDLNFLLPEMLGSIEVELELKKIAGGQSPGNSPLIEILDSLNLLDSQYTEITYQHHDFQIRNVQESNLRNVAVANYLRRIEIEAAGISHLPGVKDGGVASLLKRENFRIEIRGNHRIAVSIFGALIASGFNGTDLIVPEQTEVTSDDLVGGFLLKRDLGSNLKSTIEQLRDGSSLFPDRLRSCEDLALIIAIGSPAPESMKSWLEAGIPQLYIDFSHSGSLRLGPFVRPGFGACYNCISLTEGESGAPLFGSSSSEPELELCNALVLIGAGAVAAEVARFAATGKSELHQKSIRISLADFYAPQITTWERHPRCGCNWI